MLTGPSVSQFCIHVDAVLSQNFIYQSDDFLQANSSPLDQARYHLNVKHSCLINFSFTNLRGISIRTQFSYAAIAPGVQILFFYLALFAAVIFNASLDFIFAAVSLPTTERTAKITTAGIAGVGKK